MKQFIVTMATWKNVPDKTPDLLIPEFRTISL
jgi:hypothetical protein